MSIVQPVRGRLIGKEDSSNKNKEIERENNCNRN